MNVYFDTTASVLEQITELYDFIWPTVSAMWNFRWQIKGFVNEVGAENIGVDDLHKRFDWGSKIHGVNLKRAYLDQSWEAQQERFARILLTNIFSIHEGWLADIQTVLNIDDTTLKSLQFPTRYDANNVATDGIKFGLQQIQANPSVALRDAFYNRLASNRKFSFGYLDNLLKCYRFFKESRNCIAHNGGKADQKLINAYLAFQPVATIANLGLSEVPTHNPPVLGTTVRLSLRGVVGFSDIIIRIITTLDAELSFALNAEAELISRCQYWVNSHPGNLRFRDRQKSVEERTRSLLSSCSFPSATTVLGIQQLLQRQGIIR
jgi:hypothetical protein